MDWECGSVGQPWVQALVREKQTNTLASENRNTVSKSRSLFISKRVVSKANYDRVPTEERRIARPRCGWHQPIGLQSGRNKKGKKQKFPFLSQELWSAPAPEGISPCFLHTPSSPRVSDRPRWWLQWASKFCLLLGPLALWRAEGPCGLFCLDGCCDSSLPKSFSLLLVCFILLLFL